MVTNIYVAMVAGILVVKVIEILNESLWVRCRIFWYQLKPEFIILGTYYYFIF